MVTRTLSALLLALMVVGLVAGLATWIAAGVVLADDWWAWVTALVVAVGGAVALSVIAPLYSLLRRLVGRVRSFGRRQLAEESRDDRDTLVETVISVGGEPVEGLH